MEGQNRVLERIAQGQPLVNILETLALVIEAHADVETYCSFLLYDAEEKCLRHGAAPSLSTAYCQLVDGIPIGPSVGSCGTAVYYNASVIVEDINTDPLWADFRSLAQTYGLRACWSTPILSCKGDILATFAMYHPFPHKPTPHDRALLEKATYLARIAIERHQSELVLQATHDSLEEQVIERTQNLQIAIQQLQDQICQREQVEAQLQENAQTLEATLQELHRTQARMIQSEKMSSIGQLVAGIAHEINNPIGFIHGNLDHLREQIPDLFEVIQAYKTEYPNPHPNFQQKLDALELKFLQEDLPKILKSMELGTERIQEIVKSLRNFARIDEAEMKMVDIHEGLENTLLILQHRLRGDFGEDAIAIVKDYEQLPRIGCYPGALNQVFLNIIANAIDALTDYPTHANSNALAIQIKTTSVNDDWVKIIIRDNGPGLSKQTQQRIFDPFFTTKPVGQGTGMGLSISYQIVTEQHHGVLECDSVLGQGTTFMIRIPVHQSS